MMGDAGRLSILNPQGINSFISLALTVPVFSRDREGEKHRLLVGSDLQRSQRGVHVAAGLSMNCIELFKGMKEGKRLAESGHSIKLALWNSRSEEFLLYANLKNGLLSFLFGYFIAWVVTQRYAVLDHMDNPTSQHASWAQAVWNIFLWGVSNEKKEQILIQMMRENLFNSY